MCLVEQTLNSRPLTPASDDPEDLEALCRTTSVGTTFGGRTEDARFGQIRGLLQSVQGG